MQMDQWISDLRKRRPLYSTTLGLLVMSWAAFVISVLIEVLGDSAGFLALLSLLFGICIVPLSILITCVVARRVEWKLILLFIAYLATTFFVYPAAVRIFLRHYPSPKDAHYDWVEDRGTFYYIDTRWPLGDAQYAGRVTLFPPEFDLPKSDSGKK